MALQIRWTDSSGVLHPEAYVRYVSFYANVLGKRPVVEVTINIYHDKASRFSGKTPVAGGNEKVFPVIGSTYLAMFHSSVDYRVAAYRFLKIQFVKTVDILEPA